MISDKDRDLILEYFDQCEASDDFSGHHCVPELFDMFWDYRPQDILKMIRDADSNMRDFTLIKEGWLTPKGNIRRAKIKKEWTKYLADAGPEYNRDLMGVLDLPKKDQWTKSDVIKNRPATALLFENVEKRPLSRPRPTTLEYTVQVSMATYPSLYTDRIEVLEHLYCVIGNGYDWIKGRLIHWGRYNTWRESEDRVKDWIFQFGSFDSREESREKYYGKDAPVEAYPMSPGFSALCLIPDDIRPDWLAGAYEVIDWLVSLESTKKNDENKEIALEVKAELDRRFTEKRNLSLKEAKKVAKERYGTWSNGIGLGKDSLVINCTCKRAMREIPDSVEGWPVEKKIVNHIRMQ